MSHHSILHVYRIDTTKTGQGHQKIIKTVKIFIELSS